MAAPLVAGAQEIDSTAVLSEFGFEPSAAQIKDERVIVGKDTVSMILPQRNFGRYDRGLYNFLFIPKGQWTFGLMASYGEFNTDDVQILSAIKDFTFKGKQFSIKPSFGYFIGNIDDDMKFSLKDVSYYSNSYALGVFYRTYVGLSTMKRFGVFNDVDLSFGSASSRFKRYYGGELRDTRTNTTSVSLNFSPGLCVFIMENVSFNVSFGVFGIHVNHEKQITDGVEEGSRTSSGANFKFNLFNINFGIGVHI